MAELPAALGELARSMGVATGYRDGLGRDVSVAADTIVAVCAAMGAPVARARDATDALRARRSAPPQLLPPVLVAWDGVLEQVPLTGGDDGSGRAELTLEDGSTAVAEGTAPVFGDPLPPGYHRLDLVAGDRTASATVISAPVKAWRRADDRRGWGVSLHVAALRSARSRSVGDLADLLEVCEWVGRAGGDLVTALPLLPTFDDPPAEPSPYSPVSRLFWSELVLDLGRDHRSVDPPELLRSEEAAAEVVAALAAVPTPEPTAVDEELARYARFRGAQARLGRNWLAWPGSARSGSIADADVDAGTERFHLVAQLETRRQLGDLGARLNDIGVRLGLDLTVGVHPDGYDAWSRPGLFATGMAVGAPPDGGFPSGQSWGFPPLLPERSQAEGHAYLAAAIAHQASVADVLRLDHVMAMSRLYWIPEGMDRSEGTYVDYPGEELFAVLCLESHRNRCELVGEDLGTVPPDIGVALPRHGIRGMYLAQFAAADGPPVVVPTAQQAALIGTHDTPTFAGWLAGVDIDERVRLGLLDRRAAPAERVDRAEAVAAVADLLGGDPDEPEALLEVVLEWLAASRSPLVSVWLEDLWLETEPVNIPGSSSTERPNWQRPIRRLVDDVLDDPAVVRRVGLLARDRLL